MSNIRLPFYQFFFLFWKSNPEQVHCDVFENVWAREVTAAAAAAHREGARGWAGISQERKCEGGIGSSAAL